jgi:predicted lysophospholipase L1 biosynthesis ABC-type transport system permease subunit
MPRTPVMPIFSGFMIKLNQIVSGSAESHQRQLVDGSDPTYQVTTPETVNPTNGSWWIRSDPA